MKRPLVALVVAYSFPENAVFGGFVCFFLISKEPEKMMSYLMQNLAQLPHIRRVCSLVLPLCLSGFSPGP